MPTYEYECTKCAHRFELFQSMTDKPRRRCPECGGKVERLISGGAGLLFKGSGFYETDYRSEGYKKAAKEDSGSGKDGAKSDTAKSNGGAADKSPKKSEKKEAPSTTSS